MIEINVQFQDFRIGEWDPETEEKQFGIENTFLSQLQPVVFDDNGIPIPELDGSIHDIFENNDNVEADFNNEDDDDILSVHELVAPHLRNGDITHITDFRPANDTAQTSEYSYNSIVHSRSGKFIDQIWAGPHHWKLKFLRRSSVRFSGQQKSVTSSKQNRKKTEAEMVDLTKKVEIDFSKRLIIKRKPASIDISKITLPLLDPWCAKMLTKINERMLKPGICPVKKVQMNKETNQLDYEVTAYKYENPNDSLYCSQSQHDENNGDIGDAHVGSDTEVEEHIVREGADQQNLAENLVENPEMVPKSYIPYALRAKQMDMKKLKGAVWYSLTNISLIPIEKSQERHAEVIPTNFSKLYKSLPQFLAEKESKELSCPLAFVALLHLCNEQNLQLTQISSSDFNIKGPGSR
ncbi:hypothetical protein JTB14_026623 [Gonioctena quinquepunctata]|nr:hypothetical protein JTB14_026623 [Gonioctena quinquepunctata]